MEEPVLDGIAWPWRLLRRMLAGGIVVAILSVPPIPVETYRQRVEDRFLGILEAIWDSGVGAIATAIRDEIRREFH